MSEVINAKLNYFGQIHWQTFNSEEELNTHLQNSFDRLVEPYHIVETN